MIFQKKSKNKINLKKYNNFKIFRNKSNFGPGMSRNFGINKSKGKYILLDSDDYLKNEFLKLVNKCENDNVDIIFCRYNKDHYPKDNLFFLKTIKHQLTEKNY